MENSSQNKTPLQATTELLQNSWDLYKRKFQLLFGTVLTGLVAISLGLLVMQKLFFPFPLPFLAGGQYLMVFLALGILFFVISAWTKLSLLYAVSDEGGSIKRIKNAYNAGWKRLLPFLGLSILISLIVGAGLMLLVIPGIIFGVWISFATFIFATEGTTVLQSLHKSREYVRGKWWYVFARLVFIILFLVVVSLVASFLFMDVLPLPFGIAQLLNVLVNIFIAPLFACYVFLLYKDVRPSLGRSPMGETLGHSPTGETLGHSPTGETAETSMSEDSGHSQGDTSVE